MPRKPKVPDRNKSPSGWWVYGEVHQWVSRRQKKLSPTSRCLVYENTRLVRAPNRETAYRKAMKLSAIGCPCATVGGEWRFAGISFLLPVYEDLEDGVEILWTTRERMQVKHIDRLVKSKQELSVFDDQEPA